MKLSRLPGIEPERARRVPRAHRRGSLLVALIRYAEDVGTRVRLLDAGWHDGQKSRGFLELATCERPCVPRSQHL